MTESFRRLKQAALGSGVRMMPSDADIHAYANGFHRRYGDFAARYARDYAERLKACGDCEGHSVWHRVADAIENGAAASLAA